MRVKDAVVGAKVEDLTLLEVYRKQVPIRKGSNRKRNSVVAKCQCICGAIVELETRLIGHNTKSCGCRRDKKATKHGWVGTRLYYIAASAKWRCQKAKPGTEQYRLYRDRGITFGFDSVPEMVEYIASLPGSDDDRLSLDRIDNDRGYERGNLRWATRSQQMHNRRNSRGQYIERYRDGCYSLADKELCPTAQI